MAFPFIFLGIIFLILWLLFRWSALLSVYAMSFFKTLGNFVVLGEWDWYEIKDKVFSTLEKK